MYKIFETNNYLKCLKKIDKHIRDKLLKKINKYVYPQLKQEPHFGPNIKKLIDYVPETWRYRIGNFRLFYEVEEYQKIVDIISIDDRGKAY